MTRTVLSDVRILWPSVFEPAGVPGDPTGKLAFSVVALLPDAAAVKPLLKVLHDVAAEKHGDKFAKAMVSAFADGGRSPANHFPIRRCDENDDSKLAGFDGWWCRFKANEKYPPTVVDRRAQKIMDTDMIYSGCWCNIDFGAYGWDHRTGGKGVSFGLNALQFVRNDDSIGGGGGHSFDELPDDGTDSDGSTEDEFDSIF